MSDPENFLSRWSRRKRDVADADKDAQRPDDTASAQTPAPAKQDDSATPAPNAPRAGDADTPFDLASLPSVESITADTDIRGFFAPGVPAELTRAALRRAWAADPKIRDFVGLEDYAWDFNAAESIPGFGKLEMTDELRREVARIVGTLAPEPEAATAGSTQPSDAAQEFASSPAPLEAPASDSAQSSAPPSEQKLELNELIVTPDSDVAVQNETRRPENVQVAAKRGRGSAMPK